MSPGKLVFIVGVGRSGTTLIQSMLNAHPEVCFPPETHFVKKYLIPEMNGSLQLERDRTSLLATMQADKDLQRLDLDLEGLLNKSDSLAGMFEAILLQHAQQHQKAHAGDKDPQNVGFLPILKKGFPEAYIVHIIRDPRDVILSRIKTEWGQRQTFAQHVAEYQFNLLKARKEGPVLFGDRYLEIQYEQLIDATEDTLKNVCQHLGLDFDSAMLNYHQQSASIVTESEMKWKGNVFKPVMRNNVAKWKKGLTARQVMKIEGGIEQTLVQLGYTLSGYGSGFQRAFWSLPIKAFALLYKAKAVREKTTA